MILAEGQLLYFRSLQVSIDEHLGYIQVIIEKEFD